MKKILVVAVVVGVLGYLWQGYPTEFPSRYLRGVFSYSAKYSKCGECGRHWGIAKWHDTWYNGRAGCFVLCEECWKSLAPEQRLPHYLRLIERWEKSGNEVSDIEKTEIVRAVRRGE